MCWYYFRETDYQHIKDLHDIGDRMAKAAAMMTDTEVTSRILGSAWPQHMNKTVAETMYANILSVGLPTWDQADNALAKGIQKELKQAQIGLATEIGALRGGIDPEQNMGGPSDDIGDVSWNVPTVTLSYPANIPNLPGHNWANAIAMATPIAHKGVTAGAKVQAMTIIDMLMRPELVQAAWDYFRNVQTKDQKYIPFITDKDQPAIDLNKKIVDQYRAEMKKYYYDPAKYKTYLEQLGIKYPTVR
jgi:aminobenzoyl-glutamate utilization protein B